MLCQTGCFAIGLFFQIQRTKHILKSCVQATIFLVISLETDRTLIELGIAVTLV